MSGAKKVWSQWTSSFYGTTLSILHRHPHFTLPKNMKIDGRKWSSPEESLWSLDVEKLMSLAIYYNSTLSIAKGRQVPTDEDIYQVDDNTVGLSLKYKEQLFSAIGKSDAEIAPLFTEYLGAAGSANVTFKVPPPKDEPDGDDEPDRDAERRRKDGMSNEKVRDSMMSVEIFQRVPLSEAWLDASDPELFSKTKFVTVESAYSPLRLDSSYQFLPNRILSLLDIDLKSKLRIEKSTRTGKIDVAKLATIECGAVNVHQQTVEFHNTRPFKVCLLGDESGSMSGYIGIQKQLMLAFYEAFKGLMPAEDIYIYGHSGTYAPKIYVYNSPELKAEDTEKRLNNMHVKAQNYDSPVLEKIHQQIRKDTSEPILMIYFSDGEPGGYNYGGESAVRELHRVSMKAKRDDFLIFGIGLGGRDLSSLYTHSVQFPYDLSSISRVVKGINTAVKSTFM